MLNTIEVNQKALTASSSGVLWLSKVYCNVVAVTAEKNVATVDKLRRLAAPCSCANRMVGTPAFKKARFRSGEKQGRGSDKPISMNTEREDVMDSMCSPISDTRSCRYRWTDGYLNWPVKVEQKTAANKGKTRLHMPSSKKPSTSKRVNGIAAK